jgi:hypothetical protein
MGGGNCELSSLNEPFNGIYNGAGNCRSNANELGYLIPVDAAGNNMLTNTIEDWFTITELEVWEVRYLE